MKEDEFIIDIICQVLIDFKSKDLIYTVLNEFIPEYETINLDYIEKPNNQDYKFKSEEEMIDFYIETPNISQAFYWNKYDNNPDKIMVGADITSDNQIVFSLTINGTRKKEAEYFNKLKKLLNSEIGVITYTNLANYCNGNDFASRYK